PRRGASDDDAISLIANFGHDSLEQMRQGFAVQQFETARIDSRLEAPAHKDLHQPVKHRIDTLFALLNLLGFAMEPPGYLLRDFLVPQLPSEPVGNFLRDGRRARAVFALHRDDSDHGFNLR